MRVNVSVSKVAQRGGMISVKMLEQREHSEFKKIKVAQ